VGSGTGSVQRSGTGVAVTGGSGTGSGGTLDSSLSQLDKAISGSGTGGSGTGRAGAGQGTQAGTGSGTGAGTGKGGTGTGGSGIVWDQPETSKGRVLISDVTPKVPSWVGRQGLTLFVTVAFTVTPNGVVATARIEKSSGYADVDAAVIDAIRRSVFSPSKGTATVTGTRPYVIRAG
jgi:TonB family protein